MKNCPNCGRATLRTADWACQWCGYPLLSTGFKKTPKTFRELQEERGYFQQPSVMAEQEPELAPEREQVPELEAEPAIEAEPSPEPAPALQAEPVIEPEAPPEVEAETEVPQPEAVTEPEQELETEPAPPPEPDAKPKATKGRKPKATKGRKPKLEQEEEITEPEAVPGPQPEPEPELAPEREQVPELEAEPSPGPAPAPEAAPISVSEIDTTAEVIEINIKDLNAIYQTDKAAAGAKLTDKTLRVTGIVDRAVANSGLDIYYVLLTSNDPRSWNVRCTFAEESSSDLRKLVRGHVVTVQGKYAGYERNILLQDCFLVR